MTVPRRDQVRELGLEMLVVGEYMPAFATPNGTVAFGVLCEMVGKCLQHVGVGRYSAALVLAARVGRPIIDCVKNPEQFKLMLSAYEAFVACIERMNGPGSSTVH